MRMRYQIDTGRRLVVAWYEEWLDPAEYTAFTAEVAVSPDYRPDYRVLAVIAPNLDLSSLSIHAMREMQAAEVANLQRPAGTLGVILIEHRMGEMLARLYIDLAASDPNLGTDIRMVSTAQEAAEILGVSLADFPMPEFAL